MINYVIAVIRNHTSNLSAKKYFAYNHEEQKAFLVNDKKNAYKFSSILDIEAVISFLNKISSYDECYIRDEVID